MKSLDPVPHEAATGSAQVLIRGTITRVTFRNEETGFCVLRAELDSRSEQIPAPRPEEKSSATIVGLLPPDIGVGMNIVARGEWQTHPKFGRQFRAFSITEVEPSSTEAIVRLLGSGVFKGFGPALAQRIVDRFGKETLSIIEHSPERLREVPGIGTKKLAELSAAWGEKKNRREVLLFFQNYGISISLAERIYSQYGSRAIETVKENPYLLCRDMWGVGFHTADKIALALGLDPCSSERIIAGAEQVLKKAVDDGHCYLPRDMAIARVASLLNVADENRINAALKHAELRGEVIESAGRVSLPFLFAAESSLAQSLVRIAVRDVSTLTPIDPALIDRACSSPHFTRSGEGKEVNVVRLSLEQQAAIRLAAAHPIVVITGGPGCGKTTVIRTIASLFRSAGHVVRLAAPTGRAAQRLSDVCGFEASTIHRLLKFDPVRRSFFHDEHAPLPLDVLIVDESSMIDVPLAASLLRAVPQGARVVFVGDADQLPSVGPGLVLAELLGIREIPSVRLTLLFRRESESSITRVAHDINRGQVPHIPEPDGKVLSDAYFIPCAHVAEAATKIEELVVEKIPRRFGFSGANIMVLSPMNQGELGIIALNRRLQARLVPPCPGTPQLRVGVLEFRLGDRVIQRVNNYSLSAAGVFNGDQGEVVGIDGVRQSLYVKLWDGREVEYPSDALSQLDLAYAITIHRAQGCEVPVVILALHDSHNILLERQLVYTAITRAKNLLVIVGTKRALVLATRRTRSKRRYTALTEMFRAGIHRSDALTSSTGESEKRGESGACRGHESQAVPSSPVLREERRGDPSEFFFSPSQGGPTGGGKE